MDIRYRNQFKRDYKLMIKRGKDMDILDGVIEDLAVPLQLPDSFRDHNLLGAYAGYKECHIAPDWLLIYGYEQIDDRQQLLLVRTGTHADLF
ncbi:addiction module toxin, RelE/StbE family [Campylobacterota bacterium]|nr:addiction module toxin, RelE/StbE family [Campylobacterota bacterium]